MQPGQAKTAPGPSPAEAEVLFPMLRDDPVAVHVKLFAAHGDIVRMQAGPLPIHFLFHPDHVRRVLLEAFENYTKDTFSYRRMRAFLGEGLLLSEGSHWKQQRRTTQAALFARETFRMAEVARLTRAATLGVMDSWAEAAASGSAVNLERSLIETTFLVIGRIVFGEVLDLSACRTLLDDFAVGIATTLKVGTLAAQARDDDAGYNTLTAARSRVDARIYALMAQARSQAAGPNLLTALAEQLDEQGHPVSDEELRDQTMTLLTAGHETSAHAIGFVLYLLSKHPEVERRVHEQALEFEKAGHAPDFDLPYLDAVLKETLRLYPPGWAFERRAVKADTIDGYEIPAGSTVLLSPFITQRHHAFWTDPERFWPERFLDPQVPAHRYAFFPFSTGPRVCLGGSVGMLEMKIMLATICRRFRFECAAGFSEHIKPDIVLRFANGQSMRPIEW